MEPQDSITAFDNLIHGLSHVGDEVGAGRRVELGMSRGGTSCAGYRATNAVAEQLYGVISDTDDQLKKRKLWSDRSLVFRADVDGQMQMLCPLVEYDLPNSKSARKKIRLDAEYCLIKGGRIAVIDDQNEYSVPSATYWLYNPDDCQYVGQLLDAVRNNYR